MKVLGNLCNVQNYQNMKAFVNELFCSGQFISSNPLTVRIKVTTVDKSLVQFLSYKVYF